MRKYGMNIVCLVCYLLLCFPPEACQAYVDETKQHYVLTGSYHRQTCKFASCLNIINLNISALKINANCIHTTCCLPVNGSGPKHTYDFGV